MAESPDPPLSSSPPLPLRNEWIAIAAITLLAAALRLAYPDRMAIEHFDEGVYASNIFFGEAAGGQYPYRHLYAPPLLPWLIEWGIIFLGSESIAPFLPALVLGIATVPLMWWIARSWFGPWAGLAAALLVATSDFHILYSRAALTDVPVMFFIVLAVYLYFEAVRRESLKWAIWAGVATGLAWWTKYTGWLPLAIALAGSAGWVLGDLRSGWPRMRERAFKASWCWGVMAVTAFVVWSPVLYGLQEHGGYAAVAENHRGYLISDAAGWFGNVEMQMQKLMLLSGLFTGIGVGVVVGLIPVVGSRPRWWDWLIAVLLVIGVPMAMVSFGPVIVLGLFTVAVLLLEAFWRLRRPFDDQGQPGQLTLPLWLLTAWLVGMVATTPLYAPYPRMMFPGMLAAILICCNWLASPPATRVPQGGHARSVVLGILLFLMIPGILVTTSNILRPLTTDVQSVPISYTQFPPWQDRTGAKQAAEEIIERIRAERGESHYPIVVYTYGEPAVFFYLRAMLSGEDVAVFPTGDSSVLERPVPGAATFVVEGQSLDVKALWLMLPNAAWLASNKSDLIVYASLLASLDSFSDEYMGYMMSADQLPKEYTLTRVGNSAE